MVESRLVFTSPEYFATSLISITSIIAEAKHSLQEVTLAPNNTVNGLAWRAPNRADGKCLWSLLGAAVITGREALLDHLHLTIEASGTALDQRHTSREAHFVHMSSRLEIVEEQSELATVRLVEHTPHDSGNECEWVSRPGMEKARAPDCLC